MHRFHCHLPDFLCVLSISVEEQSDLHAAVSVRDLFDLAVHGHAAAGVAGALSEPCSCGDVHLLQGREEVGGGLRGPVVVRVRHLPLPLPGRQQLGRRDTLRVFTDHAWGADAMDGCNHLAVVHHLRLHVPQTVVCRQQKVVSSHPRPWGAQCQLGTLLHLPV